MRVVVYGAGAVGGTIGGRLRDAGHEVVLIARGEHGEVLRRRGLELVSPDGSQELRIPTVEHPSEVDLKASDIVVLAMKSQDTAGAVDALRGCAPPEIGIVCAQNGVENERVTLRSFAQVYAMVVMCPATHVEPGRVLVHSSPISGILDLGRFPAGVDGDAEAIAKLLSSSGFVSEPRADIMRWKYRKLILNLANAAQALCGPDAPFGPLAKLLWQEGEACLRAAGIDVVSREEDEQRRGDLVKLGQAGDGPRLGGSTWQSLSRGAGTVETDYLNGEIVLLGRRHGFPTPANELMQRLMNEAAALGRPPGAISPDEVLALL